MKFYYAPKSVALASHIVLEELGIDYERVEVDFTQEEQRSSEYLKTNPKGRVPSLETNQGIVTETPAILSYLAQLYPQAKLAPLDDPYNLAKCLEFNLYLCATVHVAHAHRVRGSRWVDEPSAIIAMQDKVASNMAECFRLIESQLFQGPWVLGDSYSICDPYLFTVSQWLKGDGVSIDDFPNINAFAARMKQRDAVARLQSVYGF